MARGGPVLARLALVNLARSRLAAGAGHRVRRRRRRPRRLRPRLPVDADPQRGRSGGGPRPARRACLAGAGFQHPARVGSAAALASARGRHRAAHPPDGCELHQRRGDRDGSRARRSRRRTDPDPRLAGERRLGAADRARPAPRANRPGPGARTDASGRRALAVAASFPGPGRRDRGPARSRRERSGRSRSEQPALAPRSCVPPCRPDGGSLRLWSSTNPPVSPSRTAIRTARTRPPPPSLRPASRSGRCSRCRPRGHRCCACRSAPGAG